MSEAGVSARVCVALYEEACVQNAKDTFYEVLRGRLAALNPERTVVVRGITRPGVLVVENELVSAGTPPDCFLLRWSEVSCDARAAMPIVTLTCEIGYATAGAAAMGGMDRGRALAAMDAELLAMVSQEPQNAAKTDYSALNVAESNGGVAVAMATRTWWSDAVLGAAKAVGDRMQRSATVEVMSLQEAGEA